MRKHTGTAKLFYFIYILAALCLLMFIIGLTEDISNHIISAMPTTYTVQQDENRSFWAGIISTISAFAIWMFLLGAFWDKVHKFIEKYSSENRNS